MSLPLSTPSELLPGITARGLATAYTDTLTAPLVDIDERIGEFVVGINDLGEAAGGILDLLGDWCAEERLGLEDSEYRRIIAGRRVALEQTVTAPAIFRGWEGLTEAWEATQTEAANEVALLARVSYMPTSGWVQRVSLVVRDLVSAHVYAYGLLGPPGTFIWDSSSFDDAGFGFDFGV